MKNIFNKLKTEVKLAKAGEGHKLTEDTRNQPGSSSQQPHSGHASSASIRSRPMTASQIQAGSAALARFEEKSKETSKKITPKMMKNSLKMTEEAKDTAPASCSIRRCSFSEEEKLQFYSPFTDEIVPNSAYNQHIHEQLVMKLPENKVLYSSLMIRNLNHAEEADHAIRIICKYIGNILAYPGDDKYRKIRRNNKVFQEKVASVNGSEEFLVAVGFQRCAVGEDDEEYFVMENVDEKSLEQAMEELKSIKRLERKLYRDPVVLTPDDVIRQHKIDPDDNFFKLTATEVKREQRIKSAKLEESRQLRTRAMRESSSNLSTPRRYAVIRVKFPDATILQGTFKANETIDSLKEFVRAHINVEWAVFELRSSLGAVLDDDQLSLNDADLTPTSVLYLAWNEEVRTQVQDQLGIKLALRTTT